MACKMPFFKTNKIMKNKDINKPDNSLKYVQKND